MDYADWYAKASRPFRGRVATWLVRVLDAGLVGVFVAEYMNALYGAGYWQWAMSTLNYPVMEVPPRTSLAALVVVPLAAFVLASVLRAKLNRPRPYEAHDIKPLFARDLVQQRKSGRSLPSRHMTCAVIIAVSFCLVYPPGPLVIPIQALLCAGVAFTRIIGGVHFPRDVIAATALALACGLVGFGGFALVP